MAELSNDGKGASICAVLGNHFPNPHRVVYYLLLCFAKLVFPSKPRLFVRTEGLESQTWDRAPTSEWVSRNSSSSYPFPRDK